MKKLKYPGSGNTSWQPVANWYNRLSGLGGDYYHQSVVIPGTLNLLSLKPRDSLLDLGCGQGALSRSIPPAVSYVGLDLAENLLAFARKENRHPDCRFLKADITRPLPIEKKDFTKAAIILALQNIPRPDLVIKNAADHLIEGGQLAIVINHPCFRIPRQSSWGIDQANKLQYRRVNRYLSFFKIPVNMEPSRGEKGVITWSFHFPLSQLSQFLNQAGFLIVKIEEWISKKASVGRAAKMENRARLEFPLFLSVLAQKFT